MRIFKTFTCSLSLLAALTLYIVPAMAMSNSSTVIAGFTDLPLRNCQGTYCGELKKLGLGQEMKVIFNDTGGGWSYVEIVQTGEKGWVCNDNVF